MIDAAATAMPEEWLRFGDFQLSRTLRQLRTEGRLVDVGQRGMDLLLALVADAPQPVSKARLIQAAWGTRAVEPSNLTVQIAALRQALSAAAAEPSALIRTVPGHGYVFAAAVLDDRGATPQPTPLGQDWSAEPLTRFIGRDAERRALTRLLQANRLVTLSGIGGVGKTRLTLRLRHELAALYADGSIFLDLAPLVGPSQVKEAVAAAVGAGGGSTTAEIALVAALHSRTMLLIMDNAEHLSAPVGQLLTLILDRCPGMSALVTSRDSLGLPGEAMFRLAPMPLPPETSTLTAAEALDYDAVRLFADRARALLPDFIVTDDNAPHVAAICHRLDGIALAIEMAVPRLEVLTTRQLAERLHDRFGVVAGSRHEVLPRQRTLRSMFDWSWELLSAPLRRLLQLLAASPAGTTLGSLEAMAAADGLASMVDPVDQLTALAQKSLVAIVPPAGPEPDSEPRYRLLETTRQYALDHLGLADRSALSRLHALQVATLFEHAETEWPVTHSAIWLARYGPDADNLRAAMQWAFSIPAERELALRLTAASVSLWWELPGLPLRESRQWYALALGAIGPETPAAIQGRLWLGQSWTDTIDGDVEHFPAAYRAVQLFEQAQEPIWLGAALWRAASTVMSRDHDPSDVALLARAVRALEHRPATKWLALCQVREGDLLQAQGAFLPALAKLDQALTMIERTGHSYGLMVCGGNRSYVLFALGRHDDAVAALRRLRRSLPAGLRHPVASLLAVTLAALGRDNEAREMVVESLTGSVSVGMIATVARSMEALALILARSGGGTAAARLFGFVLKHHSADRVRFGPRLVVFERLQAILGTTLTPPERTGLLLDGAAWTGAEAAAAAISMCAGEAV